VSEEILTESGDSKMDLIFAFDEIFSRTDCNASVCVCVSVKSEGLKGCFLFLK
jgi:hypothetical protein